MKKTNYIYKNADGEYFLSQEHSGEIVLSNPSYPFFFKFEVQEPLEEIGEAKEYAHLVKKQNFNLYEGETLEVQVKNGDIYVVEEDGL
jgi:hypothetical protein